MIKKEEFFMKDRFADQEKCQFPESYWLTREIPTFSKMTDNNETQIGIIGGGMVGIMTAYLLAKSGKKVCLVEARSLLSGVTGHTTAKISAQPSLIYDKIIQTFNEEQARLYYQANIDGLKLINQTSDNLQIDCDFEVKDATVYATTEKGAEKIKKEARAYEKLGISAVLTEGKLQALPFNTTAALTMSGQAQFHPVKFLMGLLNEIKRLGGGIYQDTRAVELEDETTIIMENGKQLSCDTVVVASHYPFNDFNGLYFSKLSISRSYAILVKNPHPLPEGMYISADSPTRSLRSVTADNGEQLLLIGGDSHKTGKSKSDTQEHYHNLLTFGEEFFSTDEVVYHWSAQDMTTLDKLPYVGQMTHRSPHVLVATGFNKWGMAMGATSAKLLTDIIMEQTNPYRDLLDPTRGKFKPADVKQFFIKNTTVGKDFITSKSKQPELVPDDLLADEGGLVSVNGEKMGGYRDQDGELHLVKTTCTHMGCGLNWNNAERSWDCPCHGSRFSYKGEVLNGPAVTPLENVDPTL